MNKIIQIQDINSSDTIKTMVEKINYNFDQIMAFGGGPQGEKGDRGELGPDGEQGERGNLITVIDDISTVGSDLKVGDIAIYSYDQYIYEVKENSDGNLFFEKTSIYIKGNTGEKGASGTSDSPFKYDETHDVIITAEYNGKIPSHTFIGTNSVVSNGSGVLNIVGNKNANGIYLFTDDGDSDYCGKIYGDKLGDENILVLQGEDNTDNNYVKIGNTLLTNKIHSSNNDIKIAEITTNNEIALGDESKNTSIECNEFTVKNGNNTPIKTSSSNIILKGNLFVNDKNYNYTTSICGKSIDINTHDSDSSLCVSTHIQANENGIKIDAHKVIIGKNSQSDTQINGDATINGTIYSNGRITTKDHVDIGKSNIITDHIKFKKNNVTETGKNQYFHLIGVAGEGQDAINDQFGGTYSRLDIIAENIFLRGNNTVTGELNISGKATINGGATIKCGVTSAGSQMTVEQGNVTLYSYQGADKNSSIKLTPNGATINGGATIKDGIDATNGPAYFSPKFAYFSNKEKPSEEVWERLNDNTYVPKKAYPAMWFLSASNQQYFAFPTDIYAYDSIVFVHGNCTLLSDIDKSQSINGNAIVFIGIGTFTIEGRGLRKINSVIAL